MIVQVEKVLTCLQWNRDLIWANKTCTQWNSLLSSTILTCCITCTLDHCCCCCCWLLLLIVDCLFVTGFCGRSQLTCVIEVISRAWLCLKVNHSIFIFSIIIIVTWLMFIIDWPVFARCIAVVGVGCGCGQSSSTAQRRLPCRWSIQIPLCCLTSNSSSSLLLHCYYY